MSADELQQLLARASDGVLSAEETGRLCEAAQGSEEVRRELSRHVAIERLLHAVESDPHGYVAAREVTLRLEGERTAAVQQPGFLVDVEEGVRRWLWTRRAAWVGLFVAMATLLGGGWWWFAARPSTVAKLSRIEAVRWQGATSELGAELMPGIRLQADSGLFELKFSNGAQVVVEAPADMEITAHNSAFLHAGRLVARCPESAKGFTVDSPRGRIVDLGTEFGVAVGLGGETEVHVLEGIVEAKLDQGSQVRLRQSEAMRATVSMGTERMRADEDAFVTSLPPVANRPPGFIHWSFDEANGDLCANVGHGLGEERDTALRLVDEGGEMGPTRVPGRFGNALKLDGNNDYGESAFPGIPGSESRTVAFWVKVPSQFEPRYGFGIVSWGTLRQTGAAWQISVNPLESDGLVGRLRVGTHGSSVVGTTDLRDDRWHHCAVVMYEGARASSGVQVLLYVDGKLEASKRKAVREFVTDVATATHGVWVGRNIGRRLEAGPTELHGPFFRGEIDEIHIFNDALEQREIESLMARNVPPDGGSATVFR